MCVCVSLWMRIQEEDGVIGFSAEEIRRRDAYKTTRCREERRLWVGCILLDYRSLGRINVSKVNREQW